VGRKRLWDLGSTPKGWAKVAGRYETILPYTKQSQPLLGRLPTYFGIAVFFQTVSESSSTCSKVGQSGSLLAGKSRFCGGWHLLTPTDVSVGCPILQTTAFLLHFGCKYSPFIGTPDSVFIDQLNIQSLPTQLMAGSSQRSDFTSVL
jgi:hypothetical protein